MYYIYRAEIFSYKKGLRNGIAAHNVPYYEWKKISESEWLSDAREMLSRFKSGPIDNVINNGKQVFVEEYFISTIDIENVGPDENYEIIEYARGLSFVDKLKMKLICIIAVALWVYFMFGCSLYVPEELYVYCPDCNDEHRIVSQDNDEFSYCFSDVCCYCELDNYVHEKYGDDHFIHDEFVKAVLQEYLDEETANFLYGIMVSEGFSVCNYYDIVH